jgi:RimJ/RimL family protein N-acetyltransferase
VLEGTQITLRQVRDDDLPVMYEAHQDIANRGDFYPTGVKSLPAYRKAYEETGFWEENEGTLVITGKDGAILGHIEYFTTVSYLDEIEIGYILYSRTSDGKGVTTEAVNLLVGYLFDRKKVNRLRLVIHPGNGASKRIAEKTGFSFESVARGAWWHRGRNHDVEVWALLRSDHTA